MKMKVVRDSVLVSINKALLEHILELIHYILFLDYFYSNMALLTRHDRDYITCKAGIIYHVAPRRKSLLNFVL